MSDNAQILQASLTAQPFLVTGRLLDRIPEVDNPLGAAFSIRRLYTRYRGPIVRVRRSSDNSERDIGFVQTEIDVRALESFCAGFQGYVSIWYDQTGNERHAVQNDIGLQPQIVRDGSMIVDKLGNYAVSFNGAYLTTDWEPTESELANASAMLTVCEPTTGIRGQTGSVETNVLEPPVDDSDYPEYPFDKLPLGTDVHNLDAIYLPGVVRNTIVNPDELPLYRPSTLTMYVGPDKRVRTIDIDRTIGNASTTDMANERVEIVEAYYPGQDMNAGKEFVRAEGGPSVLQADIIRFPDQRPQGNQGTQWSRGIVGVDGNIYGIPYNARSVMVINPEDDDPENRVTFLDIPVQIQDEGEKFRSAVLHEHNGKIYCAPWLASRFMSIDTNIGIDPADRIRIYDTSYDIPPLSPAFSSIVSYETKLYAIPYDSSGVRVLNPDAPSPPPGSDDGQRLMYVARVDRTDGQGNPFDEEADLPGTGKFTSATVFDGEVVAVPGSSGTFLRVTPDPDPTTENDRVTVFGSTGMDARITNSGNGFWYDPANPDANVDLEFSGGFTQNIDDFARANVRVSPTYVVTSINVTNQGGSGYIGRPNFQFNLSSGHSRITPADYMNVQMEDVVEEVNGEQVYRGQKVASIELANCGQGYTTPPSFSRTSSTTGKGSDAVLRALIDVEGAEPTLTMIRVDNGGSGYFYLNDVQISISGPNVTAGGTQARAEVAEWEKADPDDDDARPQRGWAIKRVALTNRGFGYTSRPRVTVSGGRGGNVSVSSSSAIDGHVRAINIPVGESIEGNFAAEQTPTPIEIDPPLIGGENATARIETVNAANGITSIRIERSGRGYVEKPNVYVRMSDTSLVQINPDWVVFRNHGRLTNLSMVDDGFGYTTPPTVIIDKDNLHRRPNNDENTEPSISTRLEPTFAPDGAISEDRWIEVHAVGTVALAVPYNTWRTARITVDQSTNEFVAELSNGDDLVDPGDEPNVDEAKYAAGVVSRDRLWCIPFSENRILALSTDSGALVRAFYGNLRGQWNSATVSERGGVMYAFPASGDSVLVIDPRQPDRIETLRYGNLRGEGARFSDGVTIPSDKNQGFGGLMYAIPDRSDVVAEINPGVPQRSVDLPPPQVLMFDSTGDNDIDKRSIVAFAPTPENGSNIGVTGTVTVVDFRNRDNIRRYTLEIQKHPSDESVPWFVEGIALEENVWPNGHDVGQTGKLRAVFIPYWNSNTDYEYEGRIGILEVVLSPKTITDESTFPPTVVVDQDFPIIQELRWRWSSIKLDIERACPFPSRAGVCLGPNRGGGAIVAWVPREDRQAMVTVDFSEDDPVFDIGSEDTREVDFVDWASAQSDRNDIVTLTFPTPSSARQTPRDRYTDRLRYCAGIFTNGRVVTMPTRGGRMRIREIDPVQSDPWNDTNTFELDVRSMLLEISGLSDYWNFAGAVHVPAVNTIYAIPYNYEGVLEYNTRSKRADVFGNELLRTTMRQIMLSGRGPDRHRQTDRRYYWGGVFDGRYIYCIPYNVDILLRIDPFEPNAERRFDTSIKLPRGTLDMVHAGYRCAIVANDRIYFIPFRARRILEVDPNNFFQPFRFLNTDFGGGDKWHDAVIAPNGKIYTVPWRSPFILEITPGVGNTEPTFRPIAHGQRGIWSAGSIGADGNIYMVPYRARGVLVFDPRTSQRFQIGRFNNRGRRERDEQWIDCVTLPNQEIFGIPASRHLGLRVVPEGNTVGTMDFRQGGREFRTSALIQEEFRSRPERFVGRTATGAVQPYTVFHGGNGYAIHTFDASNRGSLAFGPRFENGITSIVIKHVESLRPRLLTLRPNFAFETLFFMGGIAGLLTNERTNEFAQLIEGGSYRFLKGTGESRIDNLFDVVFNESTGVVSTFSYQRGNQRVMETFLRGLPVTLDNYTYSGNASGGSYFQVGRVERAEQISPIEILPRYITQFTGLISEVVVFTSDQRDLGIELGRLQANAFNAL